MLLYYLYICMDDKNTTFHSMKEISFINKHIKRWQSFEQAVEQPRTLTPDDLAGKYIQITDDLAYAKTYFPESDIAVYLNDLSMKFYLRIHRNRKLKKNRILNFWKREVPLSFYKARKYILYSAVFFFTALLVGIISAANDMNYIRLILGDQYVNMTIANIQNNDPMAVYKTMHEVDMFSIIAFNNILVSFLFFLKGILFSVGTAYKIIQTGIMLGVFQYLFHYYGNLKECLLTVWIHGTIEISAIIIAGGAGLLLGNSILFPGSYSRYRSFVKGIRSGLTIMTGLIPLFIIAAILEGFVTRHTELPDFVRLLIIFFSLLLVIIYIVIYPAIIHKKELTNGNKSY